MIDAPVDPAEVGFDAGRLQRIDRHFSRYVDEGLLHGWLAVITRHGRVVHVGRGGLRDAEAGLPVQEDTIWRIYSMTKPITSVAAMALWEEGVFTLTDPVSRFIPAFADARVYLRGSALRPSTAPAVTPVQIWHLLTHTAGLTYGFHHAHAVDEAYRAQGFEWATPPGKDLAACCEAWAGLPLLFQPGSEWNYSVATDVLGRVLEVATAQPLDEILSERIFDPLGMTDTGFQVPQDGAGRLAALYAVHPETLQPVRDDDLGGAALGAPDALLGGGGLVSTATDYHRFTQMLLGEGQLEGTRILAARTLRYMARNHLPGGADLEAFGRPLFAETPFDGVGFGLGFAVVLDPVRMRVNASPGDISWGGAANTFFFVDRAEGVTALFFTQLLPSNVHPIRMQLRQLVHQALED